MKLKLASKKPSIKFLFASSTFLIVGTLVVAFISISLLRPPGDRTFLPKIGQPILDFTTASGGHQHGLSEISLGGDLLTDATTQILSATFDELGYDWSEVQNSGLDVPRIFLASMPNDIAEIRQATIRKAIFLKTILPLVLQANEEVMAARYRLWQLHHDTSLGFEIAAKDRLWLAVMSDQYRTKRGDISMLLDRVDVVPPSMALAQAAEESGWGTSRFLREGNAIFGQWTFSEISDLVPRKRDAGKKHRIRSFRSLLDSVRAYVHNLNGHSAYREFRHLRAQMRAGGQPLVGEILIGELLRYSEKGQKYVDVIREIIRFNKLQNLDGAKLGKFRAKA